MLNIDTWFLVAPQPHNYLIDQWLSALNNAISELPDWSSPHEDDVNSRYDYHLAHCVFNQMYADSPAVHAAYNQVPAHGYCEQHGYNAVEWCALMYGQLDGDFDLGPMGQQGYPSENIDTQPDGEKFMYKGWTSLDWMDFDAYEAHIARLEAQAG